MTAPTALLATSDEKTLDDLLRLAAAAGIMLDVAHDPGTALRAWSTAAMVLVGADLATALARQDPPRRDDVVLVGHAPVPDPLFRAAVALGARHVGELPACEPWLVEQLIDVVDGNVGPACTVAVVPGAGGAGATMTAAALATVAASSGHRTALVDLDPLGGGVDRVLGVDQAEGLRWSDLDQVAGRIGARSLRESLPVRDGLSVLTWGRMDQAMPEPEVVREVLSAVRRGHELVVLDVSRYVHPITAEALARCDLCLVVAPLTVAAAVSTQRTVELLRPHVGSIALVARSVRAAALGADDLGRALDVPVVTVMAGQRGLDEAVDLGLGPLRSPRGPLARGARELLAFALQGRP